jgi:hypothetical protein
LFTAMTRRRKRGPISTIMKTSIEDLLLQEPEEAEKRDEAMKEVQFLIKFLKRTKKKEEEKKEEKNDKKRQGKVMAGR